VCGLVFVQSSLVSVLFLFILRVVYCGRHHLLSSMQMLMMSLPQPTHTRNPPRLHPNSTHLPHLCPNTLNPSLYYHPDCHRIYNHARHLRTANRLRINPLMYLPHELGGQSSSSMSPFTLIPIVSSTSNPTAPPQKVTHSPFLLRNKDTDKEKLPGPNGIIPPLLPRESPSLMPPPCHASLTNPLFPARILSASAITSSPNANAVQTPSVIPSPLVPSTNIPGVLFSRAT
jgi:hypothetical protein